MSKHRLGLHHWLCFSYLSRTTKRPFTACHLPTEAISCAVPISSPINNHKTLCFSLAKQLILRGLFVSAQKVIQRIIKQSSSVSEAISAVEFSISRGIEPDATSYSFLIRQLVASGETQMAEDIYVYCILKRGIEPKDQSLLNSMAICYCHLGKLEEAKLLFDKLLDMKLRPCSSTCNALIEGFCGQHSILDWFDVFVVAVDAGRGRVEETELSMDMESYGFVLDKVMYTTLINGYSKNKKMKMAMRGWVLHQQMAEFGLEPDACNVAPSVHSYTALIVALYKENRLTEVDVLYNKMLDNGLVPDHVLFFTLVKNHPRGSEITLACTFLRAIAKNDCGSDLSNTPSPTS
ncbi:pentatricopeptide repeat-containing protein At5g62370-like [Nicotiana sylvestris]|uniref:pentatricopeptide repeat-containing protein At5g62370-like n=1 Tax=Nicotiana sylvestris TaxID=4096 RepID=UPI00388C8239